MNRANIKQPISIIGLRVDAETGAIGRADGDGSQNVAFELVTLLTAIDADFEPGAAIVAEEELLERGPIVEAGAAHGGDFLHPVGGDGDIGIEAHAEGVGEISAVHDARVDGGWSAIEGNFERGGSHTRQLEGIPGIVIARTSADNAKRNPL